MKIFIGCSASNNIFEYYETKSKKLIEQIIPGNDLVFGACHSGLMAIAHDVALENDSKIIGICPAMYVDDFKSLNCNEEIVSDTVAERTQMLINYSDALVFLPGGIGTLHEFLTALECKKCHEFDKPIVLYNVYGFYDNLIKLIDKQYDEGFLRKPELDNCLVSDDIDEIKNYIESYHLNKGIPRVRNM